MRAASIILFAFASSVALGQSAGDPVLWRHQFATPFSGTSIAAAADGTVYSSDNLNLYALDPADGAVRWTLSGVAGIGLIDVDPSGVIYAGGSLVSAISPDGLLEWTQAGEIVSIASGPTVGPDGRVYALQETRPGDGDERIGLGAYVLDPNTGAVLWSDRGDPEVGPLQGVARRITFTGDRFFTSELPLRSPGLLVRAWAIDGGQLWTNVDVGVALVASHPQPLPGGRLVANFGDDSLIAIDPDGSEVWTRAHPGSADLLSRPAVGPDGTIYAGDFSGVEVWALSPEGKTLYVTPVEDDFLNGLSVSPDGRTLVLSGGFQFGSDGWVRAVDAATGQTLWQLTLPREQDSLQGVFSPEFGFAPDGSAAYFTTRFAGGSVPHSYLYAVALADPANCPADLDGDNAVGSGDLASLLAAWGDTGLADLDDSGSVGSADLAIVLASWGPCE